MYTPYADLIANTEGGRRDMEDRLGIDGSNGITPSVGLSSTGDRPELDRLRIAGSTAAGARRLSRSGAWTGFTHGFAPGHVQGNLVVLPARHAGDFLRFCQANPKPCPVIAVSAPGSYEIPELGAGLDLRTDVPAYRVWSDGELVDEPSDVRSWWRDDLVAFVLGCSFSFEEALTDAGLEIRHLTSGVNVPMYSTSIACRPAGPFAGPMVVSMRPFIPADAIRAIQITSRFPAVHGAPVHFGDPSAIGIADLTLPDYGDPVEVRPGEVPVFWACGVTPQAALARARPDLCITHAPGAMLVTDLRNAGLAAL